MDAYGTPEKNNKDVDVWVTEANTARRTDSCLDAYFRRLSQPAEKSNIQSVTNWVDGNKPLAREESAFLHDWEDLVSPPSHSERAGLHRLISKLFPILVDWGLMKVVLYLPRFLHL